jgi:multiple sugar transport system substrate-binding protein
MHLTRRSRRATVALAAAALAVSAITGCASVPDPDTVTVLNSATDSLEHAQEQAYFDRCAKPLGVRVRQTSVPADQVTSKALRMASSHSLTDILELDGSEVPQFAATGGLVPVRQAGVDVSGMSHSAVTMGSYGGG